MQLKALSLLFAAVLLATFCIPSSEAQAAPPCFLTTQPSGINCSPAKSIDDIQQFLRSLSVKDFEGFHIHDNDHIRHLPAGLLEGLRFSELFISGCSQLSRVDDLVGTSGASLRVVKLQNNALTEVPALSAPNLVRLQIIQPAPLAVSREAFKGMTSIEEIIFLNPHVRPYAFLDLKNLKSLEVIGMPNEAVVKGAFHFASPVLQKVLLLNDRGWKGQAQAGAYDGFVKGSRLRIIASPEMPPDVYFNVLKSGAILDIPEPIDCGCNVTWMRFAPFVSNAQVRCQTAFWPADLESTPEENYANCTRIWGRS